MPAACCVAPACLAIAAASEAAARASSYRPSAARPAASASSAEGSRLVTPFTIAPGVRIPAGEYDFVSGRAAFTLGQQRPFSGNVSVEYGTFYDGSLTSAGFSRSRVNVTSRFSLEPTVSINWIDQPTGSFTAKVIGSRVTYTVTPLMFVSALVQYNSSTNLVGANVRLRWE